MGLLLFTPNFSEGRRPEVVEALGNALGTTPGVRLLGLAARPDHNRMVVTAAGPPEAVAAAALRAAEAAVRLIDLTSHRGTYPRMGVLDVLPISPLAGTTLAEAVAFAREIGPILADRLELPIYFFGHGTDRSLETVRAGGFEGLTQRMEQPGQAPDAGPPRPHPTAGATAVGVRPAPLDLVLALAGPGAVEPALEEAAQRAQALPGVHRTHPLPGVGMQVRLGDWEQTPLAELVRALGAHGVKVEGIAPLAPLLAAVRAGLPVAVEPDQVAEWAYWAAE